MEKMLEMEKSQREALNEKMRLLERALTNDKGLPNRPWFKHMIYAPGFYTGYGVKTLPGVREAIEQEEWDTARTQIHQLSETLNGFNEKLKEL